MTNDRLEQLLDQIPESYCKSGNLKKLISALFENLITVEDKLELIDIISMCDTSNSLWSDSFYENMIYPLFGLYKDPYETDAQFKNRYTAMKTACGVTRTGIKSIIEARVPLLYSVSVSSGNKVIDISYSVRVPVADMSQVVDTTVVKAKYDSIIKNLLMKCKPAGIQFGTFTLDGITKFVP